MIRRAALALIVVLGFLIVVAEAQRVDAQIEAGEFNQIQQPNGN